MYLVNSNYKNNGHMLDKTELMDIDGFLMGSNRKVYSISGCDIKKISISSKTLANPVVFDKVKEKYDILVQYLTEILIDDDNDESGDAYREALNRIEKFRLIIKNKYRKYLTKKELEYMSKHLVFLQKELNKKLLETHNSFIETLVNEHGRGR